MEKKEIVLDPRCPTHGWVLENGESRSTSRRHRCVRYVEYDRTGVYVIREEDIERSRVLEPVEPTPEPQPRYAPTGDLNYVSFDTMRLYSTYGTTTPVNTNTMNLGVA